jgi:hypothetical protein
MLQHARNMRKKSLFFVIFILNLKKIHQFMNRKFEIVEKRETKNGLETPKKTYTPMFRVKPGTKLELSLNAIHTPHQCP